MTQYTQTAIYRKFHAPIVRKGKVVTLRRDKILDPIANEKRAIERTGLFVMLSPGQKVNLNKYFKRVDRRAAKNKRP